MFKLSGIFGDATKKTLRQHAKTIELINQLEPQMEALSDELLRGMTQGFRIRLQ